MKGKILIIDDNEGIRNFLSVVFERNGYEVIVSENGRKGIDLFAIEGADVILTDFHMPEMDGLETLRGIMKIKPDAIVIMLTIEKTVKNIVTAMKEGAYDYIIKEDEGHVNQEEIEIVVERGIEDAKLKMENAYLREELKKKSDFSSIVGNSIKMKEVFSLVDKVVNADSTVIICGDSGTGKELIAQSIHYNGKRAKYPFLTINCSAIPETLLESELFGYEKGAFTGASATKKGLFEVGDRGTIFLDEIGEMPLSIQAKVLRILEEKEFMHIGSTKAIKVDTRVVVATNKNLEELVKAGKFREDLFYRLNVVPIRLPSLRERGEDIPLLVRHFIEKHNKMLHKNVEGIEEGAMDILRQYLWPGNVRELENMLERTMVLLDAGKRRIGIDDLPADFRSGNSDPEKLNSERDGCADGQGSLDFKKVVADFERKIIGGVLSKTRKKKEAARLLNLKPRILRYLIKKYGFTKENKFC